MVSISMICIELSTQQRQSITRVFPDFVYTFRYDSFKAKNEHFHKTLSHPRPTNKNHLRFYPEILLHLYWKIWMSKRLVLSIILLYSCNVETSFQSDFLLSDTNNQSSDSIHTAQRVCVCGIVQKFLYKSEHFGNVTPNFGMNDTLWASTSALVSEAYSQK